jgi:hypothetical protein
MCAHRHNQEKQKSRFLSCYLWFQIVHTPTYSHFRIVLLSAERTILYLKRVYLVLNSSQFQPEMKSPCYSMTQVYKIEDYRICCHAIKTNIFSWKNGDFSCNINEMNLANVIRMMQQQASNQLLFCDLDLWMLLPWIPFIRITDATGISDSFSN